MVRERGFAPPTPWSRTRSQAFFNFREKERGGSFLFSKACKSLCRRRFKEIEDTPLAAYFIATDQKSCGIFRSDLTMVRPFTLHRREADSSVCRSLLPSSAGTRQPQTTWLSHSDKWNCRVYH